MNCQCNCKINGIGHEVTCPKYFGRIYYASITDIETFMSKPFFTIPGFSKYETDGTTIRNKSTLATQHYKTKTSKYQLWSDEKYKSHRVRKTIYMEQVNKLLEPERIKRLTQMQPTLF